MSLAPQPPGCCNPEPPLLALITGHRIPPCGRRAKTLFLFVFGGCDFLKFSVFYDILEIFLHFLPGFDTLLKPFDIFYLF